MAEEENRQATPTHRFDSLLIVRLLDGLLGWVRSVLTLRIFQVGSAQCVNIGHYALMVAAALGFLYALLTAVKSDSLATFLMGLGWIPLVAILQYVAAKFSSAGEELIKSSPSRLASQAFLDSMALLHLVGGVILFVWLAYDREFLLGVAVLAYCLLMAWFSLQPVLLNIAVSPSSGAGQEAIGIVTYFMKAWLKLVPWAFGIGGVIAIVVFIWAIVVFFNKSGDALDKARLAATVTCSAAILPLAGYLLFVVYYLSIDLMRSILVLPEKADAIRNELRRPPQA